MARCVPSMTMGRPERGASRRRVQPVLFVTSAPGSDGVLVNIKGSGDSGKGLASVEFEQGSGAFEGFGGQRPFGEQCLKRGAVSIGKRNMLFLHRDKSTKLQQEVSVYFFYRLLVRSTSGHDLDRGICCSADEDRGSPAQPQTRQLRDGAYVALHCKLGEDVEGDPEVATFVIRRRTFLRHRN